MAKPEYRYDGVEQDADLDRDWRNGPVECVQCKELYDADMVEPCELCGKDVCNWCYDEHLEECEDEE